MAEFAQFHHETLAFVVDEFGEGSGDGVVFVVDFDVFGFDGFCDVLFGGFHWRRDVFFFDF